MKTCAGCGKSLASGETYYQQITAWVADTKRDSVTLRADVSPPRFACRSCISRWQHGINDEQEVLV